MIIRNDCNKEIGPLRFEIDGKCYLSEDLYIESNKKLEDLLLRIIMLEKKTENCVIKVPVKCYEIITIYRSGNKPTQVKEICENTFNSNCKVNTPFGWEPIGDGWFRRVSRNSGYLYTRSFRKTITGGNPYLTEKEYMSLKGNDVGPTMRELYGPNINMKNWLKIKKIR